MEINVLYMFMIGFSSIIVAIIPLYSFSISKKKFLIILSIFSLVFGIYTLQWIYKTVRLDVNTKETIVQTYEVDKITTRNVIVGDYTYDLQDHIKEIKINTKDYQNMIYEEEIYSKYKNKYFYFFDITLCKLDISRTLYTNNDVYNILTNGYNDILYER